MKSHRITLLLIAFIAVSCSGNYARLGKEQVIRGFPKEHDLARIIICEAEVPGIVDIKHLGNRLYCMTMRPDGLITALDDKTLEPCGKPFLHMGNGPLETLAPIPFRQMFFHKEEGCVLADFFNMGNRLIRLNFSLSESEGKDVGQSLGDVPEGLVSRAPLSMLEDSVYFFQSPMDQKSVQRGLWQDDKIRYTPAQERLNSFSLRDPDPFMFNIFFSAFAYSPEKRRFVEASTMQNTIHLYDLEGPFAKTLSINGPVRDYHTMTEDGMEGISLHSQAVQSFSDFFVVLYCEHPLSNPSGQNPSLLCFDWEGNPLMRINLPLPVTAFSINDECSVLYCMDQSTERVVALKVDELFDL
ncbi:MAG: hypothetical protein J5374_08110 [Bacteroidales bacterium]|nr:hypothetical protein [Bacteroidales bacterium]